MVALSILRRISTMWKDVVDDTPSLWTIISATFPEEVNRASLARSGSSPIVIYFPCSSLAFRIDPEVVDEVPQLASLRLVALKIEIDLDPTWMPGDTAPFSSGIEISNEALENIRAIDLPQTLALNGAYDDTITHEHIFNVLFASPGLETLTICDMIIGDPLSSLPPSTDPISLPQLRSITLMINGCLTNDLLRIIRPPPDLFEFDIRPTHFPSPVATTFWYETMTLWVPVVQQLYVDSDDPVFRLISQGACRLETHSEYFVVIEFKVLPMAAALRWIHDVIGPVTDVDGGPRGLRMWVLGPAFEDHGVLAILPRMPGLTEISIDPVDDLTRPSLYALFNVLGQTTTDSAITPYPIPTFPTLQKLVLNGWRWKLDGIIDMLQKRYSVPAIHGQRVPDLTLDLSSLQLWMLPWREKAIISFLDVEALRELDGVKEVRMGCVFKHSGTLAVIWDEEKSIPAWG
ncbi:hypothetical protein FS837_000573 [Tulasnella sp. UAMH 9824]|nr:hypothetical protein FS837_000573 [Tulasnella sp. UAMH 9824]